MNCPIHSVPFRTVPAGVSKSTGRPYNAFEACPERGCKERPPKNYAAPLDQRINPPVAGGSGGAGNLAADKLVALQRIADALEKIANKDLESAPF